MPAYFTPELFRFLTRLKRNNNRDWFLAHKDEYESHVRQPALQFITDFAGPLYEHHYRILFPILAARADLCFASIAIPASPPTSVPTRRISPCASRIAAKTCTLPASICILSREDASPPPASGIRKPPTLLKVRNAMVERGDEWRKVRKLLNWDDASKLSRPPRGFPA